MHYGITAGVLAVSSVIAPAIARAATQDVEDALISAKEKIRRAEYRDAEQLYRDVLKQIGNKTQNEQLAAAFNGLGTVMQFTGRLPEAEKLYKRAIETEQRCGNGSGTLSSMRNNLASLYYHLNRLDDAEKLHREVLAERERTSGPNSVRTAVTLNNLAEVVRFRGKAADARPMSERSITILDAYGDVNSQVLLSDSLHTLGRICADLGDVAEAEKAFERSRSIRERTLGPQHPKVAESLLSLASVRMTTHHLDEAERLLLTALPVLEKAEVHSSTAIAYNNLAQVYKLSGRYTEAEPLYRHAISVWMTSGELKNPSYALTLSAYADLLRCDGRIDEALRTYQRALDLAERQLGGDHPDTVGIRNDYAALRTSLVRARSTVSAQSLRER